MRKLIFPTKKVSFLLNFCWFVCWSGLWRVTQKVSDALCMEFLKGVRLVTRKSLLSDTGMT